jgi:DNA-binding PadR family transcriptional regulator
MGRGDCLSGNFNTSNPYTSTLVKMKETRLGEFEEVILLLVGILGEEAYAFKISEEFEKQTGRPVSIGATHSTLDRLENKGFLKSEMGKATAERGGRRKRIFTITALGKRVLKEARDFKMALWEQYPAFAGKLNYGDVM